MGLEALEFLEGRQVGVLVVQVDDEADRDLVVLEVVEERAAAGLHVERPAERMLDEAGLVVFRLDLPELLEADAVFAGLAAVVESLYLAISCLASEPRAPSPISTYLPSSAMPGAKPGPCEPSRSTPMSPVTTPVTAPSSL